MKKIGWYAAFFLCGFVIAAYLSWAISWLDGLEGTRFRTFKEIPPWISAATSIMATLISAFAVYFVAETLRETKKTLSATIKMATDQKRIGDAQIRPWVMVDSCVVETGRYDDTAAHIVLKNFGPTPARFITIDTHIWCIERNTSETVRLDDFDIETRHYIAPGQDLLIVRDFYLHDDVYFHDPRLSLRLTYHNVHDIPSDNDNEEHEYHVNFYIYENDDTGRINIRLI